MPADRAERMFLLTLGAEPVPKSLSVRGAGDGIIWCPVIGIVVGTADGWLLLETGFSRRFLDDEAARRAIYTTPEQPRGEPVETALAALGLEPGGPAAAAVSHLHCDHAGGLARLAHAGVPVFVHADELAFARERAGPAQAYHPPDYTDPAPAWRVLEGVERLAPGVWALPTPGHTPGHMSYRVELPASGTWLFAVDAADLAENLNDRVPPGSCADPADAARAAASLRWLLEETERRDARLVPGHDMAFWAAVRHPEGGWR